ncbi:hypothetical protein KUTeg_023324 [Tegillarca granosa]|uniref:Aminotransferase class I/classII large domain-containing protein n=1 Tax=Tegillarca granosa TaxID=220873 RepID=A0ABQ9E4U1_TEGGR|nr:hypothetical protein KUTeg_023324 [Tegillarca granosa]
MVELKSGIPLYFKILDILYLTQGQGHFCLNQVARSSSAAVTRLVLERELSQIKDAGTYKSERIITSKQGASIKVKGQTKGILNFCANNYLGLASHPEVIEAGKKALDTHGAGLSSVRFICDAAILYASCFDANAGLFEVLLNEEDAVLSDELNHASIIDGIRLCKAKRYRYKHLDVNDLETQLKDAVSKSCPKKLIATDGVFSMDGNVAKLPEICDLADKYEALVFIDECHATGFFGSTGRGTEEYFGLNGRIDIINSTLGKALGGAAGGYTAGPQELVDLLRQRSRPYLFSNTLPPPVVACASKAIDLIMQNTDLPKKGDKEHPICPVMLGDARLATTFADEMLGKARIRVQISASHSEHDIDRAVDAFVEIGRKLKILFDNH